MNRSLAQILSVVGHPFWVLTGVLALMLNANPFAFGARSATDKRAVLLLFGVFVSTALLPAIGSSLMKGLGFIRSFRMEDKQERIGPYILSGVFYLWLFKNLNTAGGQVPHLFVVFVLGATIALFLDFFVNIFTKISAHATGMGALLAMLVLIAFRWEGARSGFVPLGPVQVSWLLLLALATLLAGAVGTARLTLQTQSPTDLYRGYAVGVVAVLLAYAAL